MNQLREVLDHWRRTDAGVKETSVAQAVDTFITYRTAYKLNLGTRHDITWRLHAFKEAFGSLPIHQLTPGQIDGYLRTHSEGWSRRSFYKRLRPLFAHAKRHRWLAVNPFDELAPPATPGGKKAVYSPAEFKKLLSASDWEDTDVCMYVALSGLGFFRSQELVRRFGGEQVLEWSDVLFDRDLIHVREGVGKSTRRKSGNERFTPLRPELKSWLQTVSESQRNGRIIKSSVRSFRRKLRAIFEKAGVPFIDNGLRKSAISYWLAAFPEFGVAQVSQWAGNSEPSCRLHYLRVLTKEQGLEWFASAR